MFIDEAVLFGYLDGKLEHGSIEQLVLEEKWGGRVDFTDVLLMLKMDGEWKCVAKAYNQNSDTIK